jgi:hypothetical protein
VRLPCSSIMFPLSGSVGARCRQRLPTGAPLLFFSGVCRILHNMGFMLQGAAETIKHRVLRTAMG